MRPEQWDPGNVASWEGDGGAKLCVKTLPNLGRLLDIPRGNAQLNEVLGDVVQYVRIATDAWSMADVVVEAESWLFRRLQTLMYRLLRLRRLSGWDECVRLTAMTFILNATPYRGPQVIAGIVIGHLHFRARGSRLDGRGGPRGAGSGAVAVLVSLHRRHDHHPVTR
jgi:hypothetical protein